MFGFISSSLTVKWHTYLRLWKKTGVSEIKVEVSEIAYVFKGNSCIFKWFFLICRWVMAEHEIVLSMAYTVYNMLLHYTK